MQRLLRTTTVAALAAGLALARAPAADADPPVGVQVIAHRGSVDTAPESTLAAMDQAVADRADRVTIDVRLTRDGVPVVVHDTDLRRTTDAEQKLPGLAPWTVGDLTLAQVKTVDAGSWYPGGLYTGSQVLTLDEVLGELGGSPIGMTLEVKNPVDYGDVGGIGATVKRVLDAHPEWSGPRGRVAAPGRGELRLGLPGPHAPDLSRPAAGAPRQRRDTDGRDRPGVGPRDRRTPRQPHRRDREPGPRPRHLRRDLDRERPG